MITAMHSGAGKTVVSCALMAALKKRGVSVQAFKCGPDYIDPMFHSRVLGVPSRNLDLFLQGADGVRKTLSRAAAEFAVIEGAMGYYDGLGGTTEASAYAVAELTETPAVLVLRPGGQGLSLAAQVKGMLDFRPGSRIAALLLADCTEKTAAMLTPISSGVSAPMERPIGAWISAIFSSLTPSSLSISISILFLRLLPIMPR